MIALRLLLVEEIRLRDGRPHFGLGIHHEAAATAPIRFTLVSPS